MVVLFLQMDSSYTVCYKTEWTFCTHVAGTALQSAVKWILWCASCFLVQDYPAYVTWNVPHIYLLQGSGGPQHCTCSTPPPLLQCVEPIKILEAPTLDPVNTPDLANQVREGEQRETSGLSVGPLISPISDCSGQWNSRCFLFLRMLEGC